MGTDVDPGSGCAGRARDGNYEISPPVDPSSLIRPPMNAMLGRPATSAVRQSAAAGRGSRSICVRPDGRRCTDRRSTSCCRRRHGRRWRRKSCVGRPVVFVDVDVGGRNLTRGAGLWIGHHQALVHNGFLDDAGRCRNRLEGTAAPPRPARNRNARIRFAVRRPPRIGTESLERGKFAGRASTAGATGTAPGLAVADRRGTKFARHRATRQGSGHLPECVRSTP